MIVNLNFNLEAWVKNLTIEAFSEDDAITKLMKMTLSDIVNEGAVIDSDLKITDIDTDISEYSLVVEVSNIQYDLDPKLMDSSVIEYLHGFLPKNLTITLEGVLNDDDVEDLIKDKIFESTNYDLLSFDYKVIEKK